MFHIIAIETDQARVRRVESWLPANVRLVVPTSGSVAEAVLRRDKGGVYCGLMLDHDLDADPVGWNRPSTTLLATIIECVDRHVPVLVHSLNPAGASPPARRTTSSTNFRINRGRRHEYPPAQREALHVSVSQIGALPLWPAAKRHRHHPGSSAVLSSSRSTRVFRMLGGWARTLQVILI